MVVRDCMTARVEIVRPDDTVVVVRELFRRRRIRHVPVVASGRVVGIVSDRDLPGTADDTGSVDAIMSPMPAVTTPATPIEDAAATMRARKIGALPVVEGDRLVGIVSESDLLGALIELCGTIDPVSVLELECDDDPDAHHKLRALVERRGGTVLWLTSVRAQGGRQRITVRLRMPLAHTPSYLFEEAGFSVTSCLLGHAATPH
jgi:acetoin utilization protein AcuB